MKKLDAKDIGEFQRIWEQETGQHISEQKAAEYAENLLALVSITFDPRPP
jgi:hypothetical protein